MDNPRQQWPHRPRTCFNAHLHSHNQQPLKWQQTTVLHKQNSEIMGSWRRNLGHGLWAVCWWLCLKHRVIGRSIGLFKNRAQGSTYELPAYDSKNPRSSPADLCSAASMGDAYVKQKTVTQRPSFKTEELTSGKFIICTKNIFFCLF